MAEYEEDNFILNKLKTNKFEQYRTDPDLHRNNPLSYKLYGHSPLLLTSDMSTREGLREFSSDILFEANGVIEKGIPSSSCNSYLFQESRFL